MSEEEIINKDFLTELKYTFEQGVNWKNSLDSKATNMITVSSAVTTFLIALVTFLFSRISINYSYYPIIILFLLVAIVFAIIAILCFIRSYSIKIYGFPLGHEAFFKSNGEYNDEQIDEFLSYSKADFNEHLVRQYLACMKTNWDSNENKAKSIKRGQYCYIGSIIVIVIILSIVFGTTFFHNNINIPKLTICI
jgi:hypothetical protein